MRGLVLLVLVLPGCLLSGSDKASGDDVVDPPGDAGPLGDGGPGGKRVFITSMNTNADLQSIGGGATGIAGADNICNNMAGGFGLTGTWRAWISDETVDAIDRITSSGPWFRMDGQMAFRNKTNLATVPLVPLVITERGELLMFPPDLINTWTGTGPGGRFNPGIGATCSQWSSILGKGTVGDAGETDGGWTSFDSLDCDLMGRLYCLEQ